MFDYTILYETQTEDEENTALDALTKHIYKISYPYQIYKCDSFLRKLDVFRLTPVLQVTLLNLLYGLSYWLVNWDTVVNQIILSMVEKNLNYKELLKDLVIFRPEKRGDCVHGPRPCPWFSCKYHLGIELNGTSIRWVHNKDSDPVGVNTRKRNNSSDEEIDIGMEELFKRNLPTCALDLADQGTQRLTAIGKVMSVTKERARQLIDTTLNRVQDMFMESDDMVASWHDQLQEPLPLAPPEKVSWCAGKSRMCYCKSGSCCRSTFGQEDATV